MTIDTASLAVLWQRWHELQNLPDDNDGHAAELTAIEDQIVDQPAEDPADLRVKLKFLKAINERETEYPARLYASIEAGLDKTCNAGYQVVCDFDADMRIVENMTRALSIFVLADDVWNDQRDAVSAQALLFQITASCKNLREMHGELADLLRSDRQKFSHPIVGLMAERERIVSETNASPLAKSMTEEGEAAFHALVCAAGKRFVEIDEEIANTVTTSAEGLAAQVELLDLLGGDEFGQGHGDDCNVRLAASIKRGIQRLHDRRAA